MDSRGGELVSDCGRVGEGGNEGSRTRRGTTSTEGEDGGGS